MSTKLNLKQLAQSRQKKIDSPLAKYNSAGQLFCVLCNSQVKNEIYWTGHVNGKGHKENLASLKNARPAPPTQTSTASVVAKKRPAADTDDDNDCFVAPAPPPPLKLPKLDDKQQSVRNAEEELKRMILVGGEEIKKNSEKRGGGEEEKVDVEEEEERNKSAPLPEGFFDDPKEDAKARGMKFRDPQDVEWDKFVREMASEDVKSSEIVGVEQEKSAVERELDHIEEQMAQWQRVIELEKKAQEYAKLKKGGGAPSNPTTTASSPPPSSEMDVDENDSDEDDDDNYEEELDWRNKKR